MFAHVFCRPTARLSDRVERFVRRRVVTFADLPGTAFSFARFAFFKMTSPCWPDGLGRVSKPIRCLRFGFDSKEERDVCAAGPVTASFWKHTGEERPGYLSDTRTVCGISGI